MMIEPFFNPLGGGWPYHLHYRAHYRALAVGHTWVMTKELGGGMHRHKNTYHCLFDWPKGSDHTQMVQPEAAPAEVEVLATGVGPG